MSDTSFTVTKCPDGSVHVQNVVGMHLGQHHVHSEKGFAEWKKKAAPENKGGIEVAEGVCNCGLKPGWVREINGRDWFNANFGEDSGQNASPAAVPSVQGSPSLEAPVLSEETPPKAVPVKRAAKGDSMAKATRDPEALSSAAKRAWKARRQKYGKSGAPPRAKKPKAKAKAGAGAK